jgi:outer membrane protein assembly factor BamB
MDTLVKRLLCVCLLTITIIACDKKEKPIDISKYEDLDANGVQLFAPDPSLKNKSISIPSSQKITAWPSSSGALSSIPQNILVNSTSDLSSSTSYNIHKSFSRDYHFIGNNPVISDNKLFVLGNCSVVSAYNLSNLKELKWKKSFSNTEEDVFRGGGIFVSNKYLAVTYGGTSVNLLDTETGKEKWKYAMSNISRTTPIIYKGKVFVLTVDNKLYCLDLISGLLLWVNEGASEQLSIIKTSSIIGHEDSVIVPYSVGQIYAINISDGKPLWNLSLDDKFSSIGDVFTPIINNHIAYISSFKGGLYALNLKIGNIEWDNHYAGGNSIWLAGDYIFSVNKNSKLAAINKFTGKVKWLRDLSDDTDYSRPIMINKKLFIASSSGKLLVLDPATGNSIKEIQIAKERYSNPIAIQGGLYLLSEKGKLIVF